MFVLPWATGLTGRTQFVQIATIESTSPERAAAWGDDQPCPRAGSAVAAGSAGGCRIERGRIAPGRKSVCSKTSGSTQPYRRRGFRGCVRHDVDAGTATQCRSSSSNQFAAEASLRPATCSTGVVARLQTRQAYTHRVAQLALSFSAPTPLTVFRC